MQAKGSDSVKAGRQQRQQEGKQVKQANKQVNMKETRLRKDKSLLVPGKRQEDKRKTIILSWSQVFGSALSGTFVSLNNGFTLGITHN